jgi:drug/metabolite transporter (DMT)-like permease
MAPQPDRGEVGVGYPAPIKIVLAFTAIYLIWGTTYLAIRYAIEGFPTFFMGGLRFVIAGAVLYAIARRRGASRPDRRHWRSAAVIGAFLMLGGQGGVAWAEETLPSGLTAVLIATMPLWIVLLSALLLGHSPPGLIRTGGLILGFGGVLLLVAPWQEVRDLDPWGVAKALGAAVSWTMGSLYSLRARLPASGSLATAMEMLAGGVLLFLVGSATGEWGELAQREVTLTSLAALAHLIILGSLVALTAYMWLLQKVSPAQVSTYTYVNPVVALLLGWVVAGEVLNLRMVSAAVVILAAVILVTIGRALEGRLGPLAPARDRRVELTGKDANSVWDERARRLGRRPRG